MIFSIILIFANVVFLVIVIYHTRKSGLAILCSDAISTINLEESIGFVFDKIKQRNGMKKAAKFQQMRLITSPTENNNGSDVEDAAPPGEGGGSEMVTVTPRIENQESARRRSNEGRSIVSTISLDSRGA